MLQRAAANTSLPSHIRKQVASALNDIQSGNSSVSKSLNRLAGSIAATQNSWSNARQANEGKKIAAIAAMQAEISAADDRSRDLHTSMTSANAGRLKIESRLSEAKKNFQGKLNELRKTVEKLH